MAIPAKISTLINRLNQEIEQTEQEAIQGLDLVRASLSRFPDNAVLLQFYAAFSNVLLFVEIYRQRVQSTVELLAAVDVPIEVVQEAGEDLATILGNVLEVKINAGRLKMRLES